MVKYSRNVGKKFNKDGSVREFPGNTVICHIPKESSQYEFLVKLQNEMKQKSWAKNFSFLPQESFHMTIFEGVVDQIRGRQRWFEDLSLDAPLEETDAFMKKKWNEIEKPSSFSMIANHLSISNVIALRLKPIDSQMNSKIRGFRDLLAETFKLKVRGHDNYGFHISFAYRIIKPSIFDFLNLLKYKLKINEKITEEFGVLKTNEPELTFFQDMFKFPPKRES